VRDTEEESEERWRFLSAPYFFFISSEAEVPEISVLLSKTT
jgi:hypothetical protein